MLFGFFSLVMVSVFWINRAVRLFDALVADGQSTRLFFEMTALILPNVIRLALPIAGFAAAVYVTNRLSSESELTVMQATGFSPWRLARPVMLFGLIVASMMAVLTFYLAPASLAEMTERRDEINKDVTAQLLSEGTFLHPTHGVTFYIREITPEGGLRDVLLSDSRQPDRALIYTAAEAYLLSDEDGLKLVMVDGLTQHHNGEDDNLFTTHFADFTYDISAMLDKTEAINLKVREYPTTVLMRDPAQVALNTNQTLGRVLDELHRRATQPMMSFFTALIGFSTLLLGGFSRFGLWRQITIAFTIVVLLELLASMVSSPVHHEARLWPLFYLPVLIAAMLTFAMLTMAARPRLAWRRRRQGAVS